MVNAILTHLISMATLVTTTLGSHIPPTASFPSPKLQPLCISQFALVNHACASIPLTPSAIASVPSPPPPSLEAPLSASSGVEGLDVKPNHHAGGHHHHHKGHHGQGPEPPGVAVVETVAQKECCRWLRALDVTCVCNVLVYLPVFMSKPAHKYSVVVDELCEVKYECPGRKFG